VNPPEVDPGGTITASGTGFDICRASWAIAIEGTPVTSAAETASDADQRSASLNVPRDATPGPYRVVARCDSGAGERIVGEATFIVRGPATTTTTTSSTVPETTTTTQKPGNGNTTTTSTPATSSTTTTATDGGGGAGGDGGVAAAP
jgi:hypothetical protein